MLAGNSQISISGGLPLWIPEKTDCKAESQKYYRQAIGWYEKIADDNGLGFCFYGLGNIVCFEDNEAGKKNYDLSMKHFQKAGNNVMMAELTDRYGIYYFLNDSKIILYETIFEFIRWEDVYFISYSIFLQYIYIF